MKNFRPLSLWIVLGLTSAVAGAWSAAAPEAPSSDTWMTHRALKDATGRPLPLHEERYTSVPARSRESSELHADVRESERTCSGDYRASRPRSTK